MPEFVKYLPDVNAALNSVAFVLICLGLAAIKRGDEARHKKLMLSAVAVSATFLVWQTTWQNLVAEPMT